MKRDIYIEIAASLIVLLFAYTGISKMTDMQLFIGDMQKQPLPDWLKAPLVWIIPLTEIITAASLIFNKTRPVGFYAAAIILFVFTFYTILVLSRFFGKIPCSCGGFLRTLSWPQHLLLNMFFLMLAVSAIMYQHKLKNVKTAGKTGRSS